MRPSVECLHIAWKYDKRQNKPNIRQHISDSRRDLGPMGPFEGHWGLTGNDQASAHLAPKGFHMAFE